VSHDIAKVVAHYSDKYLNSGVRKGEVEREIRQFIGSITSYEAGVTDLVAAGDRVYVAGFMIVNGVKNMLQGSSLIKEDGEWKWYGNQRDVSP
jgi:hypothetical protein